MPDIPAEAAPTDCNGEPHFYAYEHGPYSPVFVGRCTMCGAIDWPDLAEQVSRRIAEALADAGVGSPASCPSAAPESTQSPETTSAAPVYPPDPVNPTETLSAPQGEDAHPHANEHASEHADLAAIRERINRAHTELGEVCAQGPSRRFRMHIPADPERDTDLIISAALNDADLLTGEVDQLRETLARALRIADYHAGQHRQAAERADRMAEMVIEKDREATQWADWLHQAEAAIARVQALVNLSERPEDYDEAVTEYQAVVGSTWEEAYWHAAMSHVDAALGVVPEHTARTTTEEANHA